MKVRAIFLVVCAVGLIGVSMTPALAVEPVAVVVTDATETGPAATDTYLAWMVQRVGRHTFHSNVWVQPLDGGTATRINPPGTTAFTGAIYGTTLAYELDDETGADIVFYDLVAQAEIEVPEGVNTNFLEFSPRLSGTNLMFVRVRRHSSSVILFDIAASTSTVLYTKANTDRRFFVVIPDQLNGNYATWSQIAVGPKGVRGGDVWLHDISSGTTSKVPNTAGTWQYGSSVDSAGTVYFGRSNLNCGETAQVIERQLDGTETVLYDLPDGRDFRSTYAVDRPGGSTDVYIDEGNCAGKDNGDILRLEGI